MSISISVGIPTKNRYPSLGQTLLSIALQSLRPVEVIVVDDSDDPKDIREIPEIGYPLQVLQDKDIEWKVVYGRRLGQHHSHQYVQDNAKGDWIFRIDDDEVAEPDVLAKLATLAIKDVGAVAPSVLMPGAGKGPSDVCTNKITELDKPNVQWFRRRGQSSAEHLYSCFLYRKGIAKYETELSPVAHREETLFSHSILRAGYQLLIYHDAVVHHFRSEDGGIRTFKFQPGLWEHDESIFKGRLREWGIIDSDVKYVILDNGLGDHYAFKNILQELRQNHDKISIACCFPEVFHDEPDLNLISIAEAKLLFGNIDNFNIYKFMIDNNWSGNLVDAFRKLYL